METAQIPLGSRPQWRREVSGGLLTYKGRFYRNFCVSTTLPLGEGVLSRQERVESAFVGTFFPGTVVY